MPTLTASPAVARPTAHPAPARPTAPPAPTLAPASSPTRRAPASAEPRGFVLYVGIDPAKAAADGTNLHRLVDALRTLTAELAPSSETHAAVALAPVGFGGRDLDVVRHALGDPAVSAPREPELDDDADRHPNGVVIDISRKRTLVNGEPANLTYKEFELLQFLVLREGRTVNRDELIAGIWRQSPDAPSERTVDVHVRRLRAKLARYQDIVRTVRGLGYRFDRHADVVILMTPGASPDAF